MITTALAALRDLDLIAIQATARSFEQRPDCWDFEGRFWRAVRAAAVSAELRRMRAHRGPVPWALPSLSDGDPSRVAEEAHVVLTALRTLWQGGYSPPVRELWHLLAAEVANERDAVLGRLREPNAYVLATVGGQVIDQEIP